MQQLWLAKDFVFRWKNDAIRKEIVPMVKTRNHAHQRNARLTTIDVKMINVFLVFGCVMEITTVETTRMSQTIVWQEIVQ
jgi:hypothetical protein